MTTPTMQNEPQLSAEMEKRLKKKMAEELHIDWAFKNVHGKPDTIIITGTPKGSYETDYNWFVKNMVVFLATALAQERERVVEEVKTIIDEVRSECRESDEERDKGDECLRIVAKLAQLKGTDGT